MNLLRLLALPTLSCLLAACSPHPGSGKWQATGETNPHFNTGFTRIEVGYEGRTDIFGVPAAIAANSDDGNGAIRRCFWRGVDAQTIAMNCVQAANTDIEESFQLRVEPQTGVAELLRDDVVIGRFERQVRAAP